MTEKIKINTLGRITNGEYANWYIFIKNKNGFSIQISKVPYGEFPNGYDDWVESIEVLNAYMKETKWEIEWLDPKKAKLFYKNK